MAAAVNGLPTYDLANTTLIVERGAEAMRYWANAQDALKHWDAAMRGLRMLATAAQITTSDKLLIMTADDTAALERVRVAERGGANANAWLLAQHQLHLTLATLSSSWSDRSLRTPTPSRSHSRPDQPQTSERRPHQRPTNGLNEMATKDATHLVRVPRFPGLRQVSAWPSAHRRMMPAMRGHVWMGQSKPRPPHPSTLLRNYAAPGRGTKVPVASRPSRGIGDFHTQGSQGWAAEYSCCIYRRTPAPQNPTDRAAQAVLDKPIGVPVTPTVDKTAGEEGRRHAYHGQEDPNRGADGTGRDIAYHQQAAALPPAMP